MNDAIPTINKIMGWIAFVLAICAALKLFGVRFPIPGSIEATAMVAVALALARL